jgi:hypothetical protein
MSDAFSLRMRCAMAGSAGLATVLAACGSPAGPTPTASRSGAASPSSHSPSPPIPGPVPTSVTAGTPPVTYAVPAGFALSLATDQEVQLASSAGTEQILFAVDPAAEDVSHALSTVNVGGETGYVLTRGPTGGGLYTEAVVVRHHAAQYEVSCTGFQGYDRSRLEHGCTAFIGSLRFVQ